MKVLVYLLCLTGTKVLMCDRFENSSVAEMFAKYLVDLN